MTPPALRLGLAAILATAACHSAPIATAPPPAPVQPPSAASRDTSDHAASGSARLDSATVPEVTTAAVAIFGDSVAKVETDSAAAPPAAVATATVLPKPATWDIDVRSHETRERVTYYVSRFQGEARNRFASVLQRGGRYEPMIRAKLCKAGLPEDLTYLALIESGYDPNAYSSAAAVGIWQLMTGTAQGTGLRVDWWIDERRDPVRSTDGAIRFLGWLNQQFGSLYLAAAAYNGGPGRIARGLTRYADELEGQTGDDRFFALAETDYLRVETRDYVPQADRGGLVAKEPAKLRHHRHARPAAGLRLRGSGSGRGARDCREGSRGEPAIGARTELPDPSRDDAAERTLVGASAGGLLGAVRQRIRRHQVRRSCWNSAFEYRKRHHYRDIKGKVQAYYATVHVVQPDLS